MSASKVWVVIRSVVDDKGSVMEAERHYLEREPLEGFKAWCASQGDVEVREYSFTAVVHPPPPKPARAPLEDLKGRYVYVGERKGHVVSSTDDELVVRLWNAYGPMREAADLDVTVPRGDPSWRLQYPPKKRNPA